LFCHLAVSTIQEGDTATCSPTPDGRTENGVVNHAFSTDTLYNQLPTTDSKRSTTTMSQDPPNSRRNIRENWREMISAICQLVKNTRYVFIVIANLFEGILLKGRFLVLLFFCVFIINKISIQDSFHL